MQFASLHNYETMIVLIIIIPERLIPIMHID